MITGRERRRKPALPLWRVGGAEADGGEGARRSAALPHRFDNGEAVSPVAEGRLLRHSAAHAERDGRCVHASVPRAVRQGGAARSFKRVGRSAVLPHRFDNGEAGRPVAERRLFERHAALIARAPEYRFPPQSANLRPPPRHARWTHVWRVPSRFLPAAHGVPTRHHLRQKSPRAKIPGGGARVLYM